MPKVVTTGQGGALVAKRDDVFDRALAGFAETYADQNERDYAALAAAVKAGDVAAETGI